MELFRASEALLRSSQPLLPFLAPAAYRTSTTRAAAPIARHCRGRTQHHTSRPFTTAQPRRQADGPPSGAETVSDNISSFLDSALDLGGKSPTSRHSSRDAQQNNPPSQGLANENAASNPDRTKSSFDDILDSFSSSRPSAPPQRRSPNTQLPHETISAMLEPINYSSSRLGAPPPEIDEGPPLKLGPTLGRTVEVNAARGMDVGKAFRSLETLCGRNSVKRDFQMQRFHERPGMKRKRLKSVRWRRHFKKNFKATVVLVQKMTRQGW
ncbi:hypothetical protein CLAFUW4_07968 [Fulvia fulva]|uniref:37S ribosomal protein mrp21, mitochondrial n=1 Tax=Passalora fulva TaxID=5499 RepID=A0A9Q8LE94_PASFU|nr:uncharacterized protein CLAFUR5_08090 [Fulvia fulva]KAK4628808.1 hypothetical protein CLAFUR4_07973 [Fulvia fulva]KAK4630466.1 hypothetical protein CLAFUR0_07970 [Fulvia fulva]UJO15083.1 hypothetical protein CLAFUR5_08090 [Fulvia fulva]WPV13015.1 hypothetical protein CLAFUW4_07968 [Fulvia fulva]WPV27716.1 hypothetical protein CLAFUW7_07969 [Fulvia fulva]